MDGCHGRQWGPIYVFAIQRLQMLGTGRWPRLLLHTCQVDWIRNEPTGAKEMDGTLGKVPRLVRMQTV